MLIRGGLEGCPTDRYHSAMAADTLTRTVDEIRKLLEARLKIRGRTLEHQLSKVGRRLPRRIKLEAAVVAQADVLRQNPKLARMVDLGRVQKSANHVIPHLKTIDPKAERATRILRRLAKWSALGISAFVGTVWYLWSRGQI